MRDDDVAGESPRRRQPICRADAELGGSSRVKTCKRMTEGAKETASAAKNSVSAS